MNTISKIIKASHEDLWRVFVEIKDMPVTMPRLVHNVGIPTARLINSLMQLEEDELIVPCEVEGYAAWRLSDVAA